jgi:hypothetical protein
MIHTKTHKQLFETPAFDTFFSRTKYFDRSTTFLRQYSTFSSYITMPPKGSSNKLQKGQKGKEPYAGLAASVSKMSVTSQTRGPKTHFLVVLGIKNIHGSDFMIGDFAGIKYYLDLMGLQDKKSFWSTIDLGLYCAQGKFKDIKIRSENEEKVVFSSLKALHRQNDYTIIQPTNLLGKFDVWMSETAKATESGDVVNIIMICHGNPCIPDQGQLELGTGRLDPTTLAEMMKRFKENVQVNFITNACGSGGISSAFSPDDQRNRLIVAAAGADEKSSGNGLVGWRKGKSQSGRYRSSYFTEVS